MWKERRRQNTEDGTDARAGLTSRRIYRRQYEEVRGVSDEARVEQRLRKVQR